MNLEQIFHSETSTYWYLLWDDASSEALIIDPVDEDIELYLRLLKAKGLKLRMCWIRTFMPTTSQGQALFV